MKNLKYLVIILFFPIYGTAVNNIGSDGEIYWDKVYEWEDSIVSESDYFMKFEDCSQFYKFHCNFVQDIFPFYGTVSAPKPFRVNIPKRGWKQYYYNDYLICIEYSDSQFIIFMYVENKDFRDNMGSPKDYLDWNDCSDAEIEDSIAYDFFSRTSIDSYMSLPHVNRHKRKYEVISKDNNRFWICLYNIKAENMPYFKALIDNTFVVLNRSAYVGQLIEAKLKEGCKYID